MKTTAALILAFLGARILSFFVADYPILQAAILAALIILFIWVYFRQPQWAWRMLLAEFFLGGNGHLFELGGLAIRTLLVYIFLALYGINKFKLNTFLTLSRPIRYLLGSLAGIVCFSAIFGFLRHHVSLYIIQDAIPFSFFLLIIPANEYLWLPETQRWTIRLIASFLVGSAVFSIFTLSLFATAVFRLQDSYYHWFRDVIGGKITDVGENFFRIVAPEHLLLPFVLIILCAYLMNKPEKKILPWILLTIGTIPFALNVSRTYMLAYLCGLAALRLYYHTKDWLTVSVGASAISIVLFLGIHFIASGGRSFGSELIFQRFSALESPGLEISAATRQELLRPIMRKIKAHPVLGSGLGDTLTYSDPKTGGVLTTRQFDWGYLEIWAKLGLLGFICSLLLLSYLIVKTWHRTSDTQPLSSLGAGLSGGLIAQAFMTITTPALFHVLGVFFLIFAITYIQNSSSLYNANKTLSTSALDTNRAAG